MTIDHSVTEETPEMNDPAPEVLVRRSQRQRRPTLLNDYHVYLGETDFNIGHAVDPVTFKEALDSDQANKWLGAMKNEMTSMSIIKYGNSLIYLMGTNRLATNGYLKPRKTIKVT